MVSCNGSVYQDRGGGGEEEVGGCDRPGRQSPRGGNTGGKMNIIKEKKLTL
jgi:hypothetical protein